MKKSCVCCQKYLEHLDGKMNCFVRRMTADSRRSMIMPCKFVNHFGGDFSGTIKLQSPNGILYVVEVTKCKNKTVLRCGWEAFVDAHHIEENDSLLFRCVENSRFEVLIFDSDDCEKVFSCAGIRNTCKSIQEKSSSSCDDTAESSESEGFARNQKGSFSHRRKTANLASSSEDSGEDSPSEHESVESGDLETSQEPYVLSRRSYLSEFQKEKVDALIQEIQPETTAFVAIMRKSNVQLPTPFLVISFCYAEVHFPHKSVTVTLQRPCKSKKWHPRFYKRKDARMNILRGSWVEFVKDNRVQEQDICVFVPTKDARRNFTFTVHLLRVAAAYSWGGTGVDRAGSSLGRTDVKSASEISIKEEPIDQEENVSSRNRNGVSDESEEDEDSEGPAHPPYIVPCKSHLSRLQKKIVEEKVRSFQSKFPVYVAIMKKSNVERSASRCQLELGARFAAAVHLPDRRQTVVLQRRGERWATVMQIRSGTRRLLISGWHRFVRDNRLRVGDICLFEFKTHERWRLTMAVHAIFREQCC